MQLHVDEIATSSPGAHAILIGCFAFRRHKDESEAVAMTKVRCLDHYPLER